jgi:formamidopyrimidine-DNA glycosylase
MPELPEVETIRRDLAKAVIGREITDLKLFFSKTAKNDAAFFINSLRNKKFIALDRVGKLLIFKIHRAVREAKQHYLLIHLKMTGQLILVGKKEKIAGGHSLSDSSFQAAVGGELPNKHTRAVFSFKNAFQLFFNDLRKFGYLKIVDEAELSKIITRGYGPEPLTKEFTLEYLTSVLKNKKISIKGLLLNQKLIAGLGNIYVDESLYLAGIRPDRAAGSLKKSEIQALYQAINQVINKAIKYRGTTFNNYVDSAGRKGNFSRLLHVYGRAKQACFKCGTPIQKKKLAGRGTHYCPHCQK